MKLWNDILFHNNEFDKKSHFKKLPEDYRFDASKVFRSHILFLLESLDEKWTKENITAVNKFLHDDNLNWCNEDVIRSLELISWSNTFELLNILILPDLLAVKFLMHIKQEAIRILFLDVIKEILNETVQQINDQLINKIYTMCDYIQDRTLDIQNSIKTNDMMNDKYKKTLDEFVVQVDIVQEVIDILSMLMRMEHFCYKKFEIELQGTDKIKDYLISLKVELERWGMRKVKTLIRFVNRKAQLPSYKDIQGISRESRDFFKVLCEIGNELERIFRNVPKQSRELKASSAEQRIMSELVRKGKLFTISCNYKTQVLNVIISLYVNHGYLIK
ncbi:hypothetical protein C1645_837382 [Glomus cerebriforme]|uniref:Uncharacterized protein n=1 Tax=Glomus cerebriforme TaxID=658196 RepID=A0A397S461_9GLOM|nr:hypothetical protein C1645_837382 [Glomus cerebriforme]